MKLSRRKNSPATLEDIARHLDVSRVTVSKALRGHPDISKATTQRVRGIADGLGYRPNIIARSLSARRSNMIGVVVPKIAHCFFGSVIEGIYNAAFTSNYETILTVSQEDPEREHLHLQSLVSMRVDGIIISVSQGTRDLQIFHWIRKLGVPLLFLDRQPSPPPEGFSSVVIDDQGGTFDAIEHAIKIGNRDIACVGGTPQVKIGRNRYAGFEAAMKAHDLPIRKRWVIGGGFSKETGHDALIQLHADQQLPELIFATTCPVALGIYEAAKELGLRIPQDLDVICFGDSDVSRVIAPALSCVRQPSYELGVKGVEVMLNITSNPESVQEQHLVLPTDFVLRETCTGKKSICLPALERRNKV